MQQQGYLGFVTEMTMEFKPMNGITHHYDDQPDFDDLDINYDGSITYREILRAIEFFDTKPDECY